jgi:hypothetical protein
LLSAPDYLTGAAELAVAIVALALGAVRLRTRLLPGWSGPPAWLADTVLILGLLIWIGELLGSFGALGEAAYFAACVAVGVGLRVLVPAPSPRLAGDEPAPASPDSSGWARVAAAVAVGLLVAHWSIGTRLHLDEGMTGFDTTWYHGPLAVLFATSGSTLDLHFIAPDFLAWFYPLNSELLHSVGILAFGRDIASPLLNLGWLGGCLLAAWCIGRPYGAGPWSLVAVAVLLDSGVLADQAGEARNDIVGVFFVLAAAAVLVNAASAGGRRLPTGALIVAGLAAGLAAGTKLNFLPFAGALLVGCVALAPPGTRRRAAAAFGFPLLAGGGYWYLRNLVQAGNPLPWAKSIGPISLPAPEQELGGREQHSIADYLTDGSVWSDWFLPGFHDALGFLWPAVLALALVPLLIGVGRRAGGSIRVLALAGLLGALAWVLEPSSAAGPEGAPRAFVSNLRHLAPALALGLALLPALPGFAVTRRRGLLLAGLLALLFITDASGEPWRSGYLWGAVALGALAGAAVMTASSGILRRLPRGAPALGAVALFAIAVGAGYAVQRDYLRDRYAHPDFSAPGLDAAFAWGRDVRDARIATISTRQYPLFGTDLSNHVQYLGEHRAHGGFVDIAGCRAWREALNAANYDYVVATRDRIEAGEPAFPPQVRWTGGDPAAVPVLAVRPTVVFRLRGPLDPRACRAARG